MNGTSPKNNTRAMREVPPVWDEIMHVASKIENGQILIKIHQKKVTLSEYTIKRKTNGEEGGLETIPIL